VSLLKRLWQGITSDAFTLCCQSAWVLLTAIQASLHDGLFWTALNVVAAIWIAAELWMGRRGRR
jgi:hypothetical protein